MRRLAVPTSLLTSSNQLVASRGVVATAPAGGRKQLVRLPQPDTLSKLRRHRPSHAPFHSIRRSHGPPAERLAAIVTSRTADNSSRLIPGLFLHVHLTHTNFFLYPCHGTAGTRRLKSVLDTFAVKSRDSLWAMETPQIEGLLDRLQLCGLHCDPAAIRMCLRQVVSQPGVPSHIVQRLMRWAVDVEVSGSYTNGAAGPHFLEEVIELVLLEAAPIHVASVVQSLLLPPVVAKDAGAARECLQWHPVVSVRLARRCVQRAASTVRQQRGRDAALSEDTLYSLHRCVQSTFAPNAEGRPRLSEGEALGFAIQSMSTLRYSPYCTLRRWYEQLERTCVLSPAVNNKFLANCGLLLTSASQPLPGCDDGGAAVIRAVDALMNCTWCLKLIEEGLVHGSSVLAALGEAEKLKGVFAAYPGLRETPHTVMMRVRQSDVQEALRALLALAQSRSEGWVRMPPAVIETIYAVSELVGKCGTPEDVPSLYRAVVTYHNPGMIAGQSIERVLAGLCQRMRLLESRFGDLRHAAPHLVVRDIVGMAHATFAYVGDDFNTDSMLTLLETAVNTAHVAVPLCTALLREMSMMTSLSIQELFQRVDQSTNGTPFLHYYTLCYARDHGYLSAVEHLCAVWHVSAAPVLCRSSHLSLPYKLWQCASCGRRNSDRYNYCTCSALRNRLVGCGACGYLQDERRPNCLLCGISLNKNVRTATVRMGWVCQSCHANNSALQSLLCFRCSAPTGPSFSMLTGNKERKSEADGFCLCGGSKDAYANRIGYCRQCGTFKMPYAARHSTVWRCQGCQQLCSSLEPFCPSCPQVENLPASVEHPAATIRHCKKCATAVANPFCTVCPNCASEDALYARLACDVPAPLSDAGEPVTRSSLENAVLLVEITAEGALSFGFNGPPQGDIPAAGAPTLPTGEVRSAGWEGRQCSSCKTAITNCSAICPHCGVFNRPRLASETWTAQCLRDTCSTMVASCATMLTGTSTKAVAQRATTLTRLMEALEIFTPEALGTEEDGVLEESRPAIVASLHRLVASLQPLYPTEPVTRRAAALLQCFMTAVDQRCRLTESQHFLPHERCRQCLGGHQEELCCYHQSPWVCEDCGAESNNDDVCRYLCIQCLALRPVVQDLMIASCWECPHCRRANVDVETYCIHCLRQKQPVPVSRTALHVSSMSLDTATTAHALPFAPCRCPRCGLVFLETRCPLCHSRDLLSGEEKTVVAFKEAAPTFVQHRPPHLVSAACTSIVSTCCVPLSHKYMKRPLASESRVP